MTTNPIDFRKFAKLVQEHTRRKEIIQERINTKLMYTVLISLTLVIPGGGELEGSLIESQLQTKEQQQVFHSVKAIVRGISRFFSINSLSSAKGGTETVKGTIGVLDDTTGTIGEVQSINNAEDKK
ncbi:hypothetical protein C8C83_0671 [Flavobacterium sp. 90]|uniref:hypothetical protein n=1 Tax=unclassified Flavobacterium TaxID=196869 RepID=UPI000EB54775|nr:MULTISPECIES: hypothetical protein [unclassified Flavobacterium]RKR09071.1 hypothetical protein C8C82_0969 [Flavobacterium sp. 81]TCK52855.1 hypothetical protein C8C83_0671 [Flavobacterium sp. 90]